MSTGPGKLMSGRRGATYVEADRDHKTDPTKKIIERFKITEVESVYKWYGQTIAEVQAIEDAYPDDSVQITICGEFLDPLLYDVIVTVSTSTMDKVERKVINIE